MLPIYFWQNPLWHTVFHAFLLIFYLFRSFISFVVSKQTNDMLPSHPVLFRAKGMQKAASVRTLGPTSAEGWHTTGSSRKSDR